MIPCALIMKKKMKEAVKEFLTDANGIDTIFDSH